MIVWDAIASAISHARRRPFILNNHFPVGGGCINESYCLEGTDGSRYFLKLNDARHLPMFSAESESLNAVSATNTVRVPQVIAFGSAGILSYLVLEYMELCSSGNSRLLGEQLAMLHRSTSPRFGFAHSNYIGTNPQPNDWKSNWADFWCEHRLGFQLHLAEQNGFGRQLTRLGEKLMGHLPAFFDGYIPQPALLHGDLWSGNHAFLADGMPVIFDPAAYYGDRECDLAMTELFGGYPADFYAAYRAAYPPDTGYAMRKDLYNLYHILNHANLFGRGYVKQAELMMLRLIASCS